MLKEASSSPFETGEGHRSGERYWGSTAEPREENTGRRKEAPEAVRSHASTRSEGRTRVISGQTENMICASIKKTQLCTCRSDSARGEKSENSVANGVVSLGRAVIATTCYSQITRPLDLKEHVIRYLNVFTGILAVTASFYSHMPTYTEFNRLRGAGSSAGISVLSLVSWSIFRKIIFLASRVHVVSRLHYLAALLSLLKKQNPGSEDTGKYLAFRMIASASRCVLFFSVYSYESKHECGK